MKHTTLVSALLVVMVASLLGAPVSASEDVGALSRSSRSYGWTRGPFTASNPVAAGDAAAGCAWRTDPRCDHLFLQVDAPAGDLVRFSLSTAYASRDNYDAAVYSADGTRIDVSNSRWGTEYIEFHHQPNSGPVAEYEIRVTPVWVVPGSTYNAEASLVTSEKGLPSFDEGVPFGCPTRAGGDLEEVTDLAPSSDTSTRLPLSVLVLLDGVTVQRANAVMDEVAAAYAPLGIDVRSRFQVADLNESGAQILREARSLLGGSAPAGVDIVHVLTNRTDDVAEGSVLCIGGAADPGSAFSWTIDLKRIEETSPLIEGIRTYENLTAKTTAHEIGHLLGAPHDYSNCVEGRPQALVGSEPSLGPCTAMWPESTPGTTKFGTLEGNLIRNFVLRYLRD